MTHDDRKVLWYKMLQQNQIAEQQIVVETQVERSESEMDRNRFFFSLSCRNTSNYYL
jgi:hypothetical protein